MILTLVLRLLQSVLVHNPAGLTKYVMQQMVLAMPRAQRDPALVSAVAKARSYEEMAFVAGSRALLLLTLCMWSSRVFVCAGRCGDSRTSTSRTRSTSETERKSGCPSKLLWHTRGTEREQRGERVGERSIACE